MATKRIINRTKNTLLADRAEVANTHFKRLKGLLGKEALKEGEGLIIKPCSSIHTFFMRFSIDAIFLDKNNSVVAIAESLPPSRFFGSLLKGKLVIELPLGTIARTNTIIGDELELREI